MGVAELRAAGVGATSHRWRPASLPPLADDHGADLDAMVDTVAGHRWPTGPSSMAGLQPGDLLGRGFRHDDLHGRIGHDLRGHLAAGAEGGDGVDRRGPDVIPTEAEAARELRHGG